MVLDSNTLDVEGSVLAPRPDRKREDQLQLLWLRNAMSQWVPAPDDKRGVWKILAMHHPPFTPRSCACRVLGKCIGGHGDETALHDQLQKTLEDLPPPDLMLTAHNHIYARSHPLDAQGKPATGGKPGVRYFVTAAVAAPGLRRPRRGPALSEDVQHLPLHLSPAHRSERVLLGDRLGRPRQGLRLLREGLERRLPAEPGLQLPRLASSSLWPTRKLLKRRRPGWPKPGLPTSGCSPTRRSRARPAPRSSRATPSACCSTRRRTIPPGSRRSPARERYVHFETLHPPRRRRRRALRAGARREGARGRAGAARLRLDGRARQHPAALLEPAARRQASRCAATTRRGSTSPSAG